MKQFQYGIGAEFLFRFETRPVQENGKRERRYRYVKYKIESCRLHDGRVEYYNVSMIEEGKPAQMTELSASRLHYLINFNLEELISSGKRKIYPLTAEEVSEFYKERNAARYYENKRALNMLESSKQYQAVIQQIKQTGRQGKLSDDKIRLIGNHAVRFAGKPVLFRLRLNRGKKRIPQQPARAHKFDGLHPGGPE